MDTSSSGGKLIFHVFGALAEFEGTSFAAGLTLPLLMEVIPTVVRHVLATKFPRDSNLAPVTYRFEVDDQPAATNFIIEDGRCGMVPVEERPEADDTLTSDTDTFVLLMYRRISLEEAISLGAAWTSKIWG